MQEDSGRVRREIASVYFAVGAAVVGLTRLQSVKGLAPYLPLAVAWILLAVPYRLADRHPGEVRRFGLELADRGGWLREIGFALGLSAVVLPVYVLGFYLWRQPQQPFVWRLPPDGWLFLVAQVVLVALPEEAFFRGYLQTRLQDVWPARALLPPRLGACVVQALLFALLHMLVDGHPARAVVFFPGLVFGWLRQRRRGIEAAIVFHALCNCLAFLLTHGWLMRD